MHGKDGIPGANTEIDIFARQPTKLARLLIKVVLDAVMVE
jgi:hypothetical protein